MKIFVYILSFYFIALTMVPCTDQMQELNIVHNTDAGDTDHEDNHSDYCSPFCICSCCSTVLNVEQSNAISFIIVLLQAKEEIAYEANFYSFGHSSIWQPPQLV